MSSISDDTWDPISNEWKTELPSAQCSYRIKRDLMSFYNDPPYGVFVVPDDSDITIVHALITGAFDTPYEGGFFYFILRCPSDYPLRPPRVKLMTTGGGEVRFNPNLYKCGKVCLSILGTWSGPCWSPAQSICSVLISIQSILNEKPYHNEPGFEVEKLPGDVDRYNEIIQHETIRVAVCGMIENDCRLNIPTTLKSIMEKTFLEYYDYYTSTAVKKMGLTGVPMQDPFSERRGRFQYKSILTRLQAIQATLLAAATSKQLDSQPSEASSPSSDTDLDDELSSSSATRATTPSNDSGSVKPGEHVNELGPITTSTSSLNAEEASVLSTSCSIDKANSIVEVSANSAAGDACPAKNSQDNLQKTSTENDNCMESSKTSKDVDK